MTSVDFLKEVHEVLGDVIALRGLETVKELLMAETRTSLAALTHICMRAKVRTNGGDVGGCQYTLNLDDGAIFNALALGDDFRRLEPPRWRNPRVWWPLAPLSRDYLAWYDSTLEAHSELPSLRFFTFPSFPSLHLKTEGTPIYTNSHSVPPQSIL